MSGLIYYFSGTGNSLYVTKLLSDELNFSYRSMSKSMDGEATFEPVDQMVLVFWYCQSKFGPINRLKNGPLILGF